MIKVTATTNVNKRKLAFEHNVDKMWLDKSGLFQPGDTGILKLGDPAKLGIDSPDNWGQIIIDNEVFWVWLGAVELVQEHEVWFGSQPSNFHDWVWLHPPTRSAIDRIMDAAKFDTFLIGTNKIGDDQNQWVTHRTLNEINAKGIPDDRIIARINSWWQHFSASTLAESARKYVELYSPAIDLIHDRVKVFQIHNEPNLKGEGWPDLWRDPTEFTDWYLWVLDLLSDRFPNNEWIYPGLSPSMPGTEDHGVRYPSDAFLEGSKSAIFSSHYFAHHIYWEWSHVEPDRGKAIGRAVEETRKVAEFVRGIPMHITEVGVPFQHWDKRQMGAELVTYWKQVKDIPNLKAIFMFTLVTSSDDTPQLPQALIWGDQEFGVRTHSIEAAIEIGKR